MIRLTIALITNFSQSIHFEFWCLIGVFLKEYNEPDTIILYDEVFAQRYITFSHVYTMGSYIELHIWLISSYVKYCELIDSFALC